MAPDNKFSGIVEKVLGYGYQIHPGALKIIESLEEEKALEVLSSLLEKFPEAIVIEVEHVEEVLGKTPVKKATATRELESKLSKLIGKITQIYDGSGLIQRCPKCNRWIIDNFCIVHSGNFPQILYILTTLCILYTNILLRRTVSGSSVIQRYTQSN
jgi:hypothetical protein